VKVVILAGGLGTRLMEETEARPKPMVEIGGRPMLWHIMQLYAQQGFDDFIIAAGYKHELIEHYFAGRDSREWRVAVVNTGDETPTGGRLARLEALVRREGTFMLTYGDGLADVDLNSLLTFHDSHGKLATLTAVQPPAAPHLAIEGGLVTETNAIDQDSWANGGFLVLEPRVFDYLDAEAMLEPGTLAPLAAGGQLMAYRHRGFWQCMDTVHERDLLESYWRSGEAPWVNAAAMYRHSMRFRSRKEIRPRVQLTARTG
jgi:glucose-1-phosphate cytidylyltransferase